VTEPLTIGPSVASGKMHIGVDFDDVLYPYHHYLKIRLKKRFGIDLSTSRVTSFYYDDHPAVRAKGLDREAIWAEVRAAWHETDDHAQAALLDPDASKILRELGKKHAITLISARHAEPGALAMVKLFLERHKIKPDAVRLGEHEKRGFDVLVDDFPRHAEENAESGGHSLLYHCDENSNYDESRNPRIHRIHSWQEAADVIRRLEALRAP